jgi:SsrA-binding protein
MAKARKSEQSDGRKMIARNRRASFEYELLEIFEAGIVLLGPEVKSLREGRASLGDAYASVRRGEAFLHKLHISPYEPATRDNAEPMRERKLLLHRAQIHKLASKVAERGFTIVPVSLYFKDGRAKVELALARGKQSHDKRQAIKQRDDKREADRAMRRGRDAR